MRPEVTGRISHGCFNSLFFPYTASLCMKIRATQLEFYHFSPSLGLVLLLQHNTDGKPLSFSEI